MPPEPVPPTAVEAEAVADRVELPFQLFRRHDGTIEDREGNPVDVKTVPASQAFLAALAAAESAAIPATPFDIYAKPGSPQGFPSDKVGVPRAPAGGFLKPGSDPLRPAPKPTPKAKPES